MKILTYTQTPIKIKEMTFIKLQEISKCGNYIEFISNNEIYCGNCNSL
jgi:hypothetical protein